MVPEPASPEPPDDAAAAARRPRVFSGRVIFDHLQKTAGMAINRWLRTALGEGCASPNLMTDHRSLIARYGGRYSVLTAHVTFDGRGFDPRYRYVTLLREPIDRMVSWLHYVVGNHSETRFGAGWHDVKRFLETDGAVTDYAPGRNLYVHHFAAIDGTARDGDDTMLAAALAAVERYELWGLYESLPEFVADFAGLLGVSAPATLARVNVTRQRPPASAISAALRTRLAALNALDLEFYGILAGRYPEARRRLSRSSVTVPAWEPLPEPAPRTITRTGFTLHAATIRGGERHAAGVLLEVDVTFSIDRPIDDLVIGLVITDSLGNRVFSTDTVNLGRPIDPVAAGTHRACCTFVANLPHGHYSVGFRFRERRDQLSRVLATLDGLCVFRIGRVGEAAVVELPTTIRCIAVDAARLRAGWRLGATDPQLTSVVGRVEGGSIVSDGRAGHLLHGPYRTVIAGRWTACVEGLLEPGPACLHIDVASAAGQVVHAALELTATTNRARLDFTLPHPVHDLEIRVWIHEFAAARIDTVAVEAWTEELPRQGGDDDGIAARGIEALRETAAAADPAPAAAQPPGAGPGLAAERPDGAAARGARAVGDPPDARPAERLVVPGDAAACPDEQRSDAGHRGAGEPRTHDAGDAGPAGRPLTSRPPPTFSLVIASDGRAAALAELLDALPFLEGPAFEVCVVRGPTADGTAAVLDAWRGRVKAAANPVRNLSISRNLGAAMAAGEIIAFLDDDAIPAPDWLVDLAAAFSDPAVACAGGINGDRTGAGLQYGHATANRMGQARWDHREPADALGTPGAAEFPYVQGTNAAIRRSDLLAIGGFDEEYDFYLDETDLCCRLVDAGRRVRQLTGARVHHRSLPSAIRTADGITHDLYAVLKNKLYFSLVNGRDHHSVAEALADFDRFVAIQEAHLRHVAAGSAAGSRWLERFAVDVERARAAGLARGRSGLRRLMSPGLVAREQRPFLPLARRPPDRWRACTIHPRPGRVPMPPPTDPADPRAERDLLVRIWGELLPAGTAVALALYPDHHNVGDAAIWWGTRTLLRSLGVRVRYGCDPWSYDPGALVRAHPHGPILLLGGGNFGDVYGAEQGLRERILRDFPERPIVQLPQSIWFRSDAARDDMARLLTTCRDVTLLLRDAPSLALARTHFPVRSLACPDAALALDLPQPARPADRPVVALWRRDVELDRPVPDLPAGSLVVDWHDEGIETPPWSWARRGVRALVGAPPAGDAPALALRRAAWRHLPALWDAVARERTLGGCRLLARGRVVITNRLHAHLLCSLLRIPHVVCDTVNGKLSAYRDTWNKRDPLVRFAADPDDAVACAAALADEAPGARRRAA